MSLINEMLKDLEQRQVRSPGNRFFGSEVRGVASAGTHRPRHLVGFLLVMLLLAAVMAWLWWGQASPKPGESSPVAANDNAAPPQIIEPEPAVAIAKPLGTEPSVATPGTSRQKTENPPTLPIEANAVAGYPQTQIAQPTPDSVDTSMSPPRPERQMAATLPAKKDTATSPPTSSPKAKTGGAGKPVEISKQISSVQNADNLYRQSVILLQQGRVAESELKLEQALALHPQQMDARQLLAGLLLDAKRYKDAMRLLQEGIDVAPEQSGFRMALARLQVESGNREAALLTLQSGLPYTGSNQGDYLAFLAALLQQEDQHEAAAQYYLAALGQNPSEPSWLVGAGISLQALERNTDALSAFERASMAGTLSPDVAEFVAQRIRQLRQQR